MARDYDVIVVGSGGAGHCAAIEANAAGARVLVLEAAERIGGTTITAGGVFYAAGTSVQRAAGVEDSADRLYEHYMTFNQWRLDPSLVRRYCDDSGPTVEWLIGLGVEYRPEDLYRAGIELGTRRGHLAHGYGHQYLTTLHNHAAGRGVEFVCNTRVSRLLAEAGRVTGLEASGETLHAAAVVLACGGLGANREMLQQYYPDAARYDDWHHYIGAPSNQGDAITLGIGIGAAVARSTLNRGVLLRAPHFNNTENEGFMPPWLVLVNREGRRFIDETANYAVMDDVINAQTGAHCFGIIDHAIFLDADGTSGYHDPFNPGARCPNWERRMLETQLERGRVARAETIAGLAEAIGVHPGALVNNIERYNRFVAGGSDEQFFKPMKGTVPIATPPFHATELRSATMVNSSVGLQIDTDARVHDEADAPIPGLYAAGEAAGGVVGKYLGGGNSIGMGAIFGRLAGRHAAGYVRGLG